MTKTAHIIGNGPSAGFYKPSKGLKILCNLPPMTVHNAYTTVMVDFKMMKAIHDGDVVIAFSGSGNSKNILKEKNGIL